MEALMKLEFTNYDSAIHLFFDTPFRDGLANIKAAFQESKNTRYEGMNANNVRVTQEVPDRTFADRIGFVFVGIVLLIPVVNIVVDLAMRFFDHVKKQEEDNFYEDCFDFRGRTLLTGLSTNGIQGGVNGLRQVLDNVISPRIARMMQNGSFQYAISTPIQGRDAVTGSWPHLLHLRINQYGKSVEWRRRVIQTSDAFDCIGASEREIARDVMSKLYDLNARNGRTFFESLFRQR
jgi:hypothetical protein